MIIKKEINSQIVYIFSLGIFRRLLGVIITRRYFSLKCFLFLILSHATFTPSFAHTNDSLRYVSADEFLLIGKGFNDTKTRYERLPAYLEDKTRPAVWDRSKYCSGLAIRFHTNATIISVKWEVTENIHKAYFAETGFKGIDLYSLEDGEWIFAGIGIPGGDKFTTNTIVKNMDGRDREFMLYLPLYDGISNLEIGVNSDAILENPRINSPKREKPVVFYGTSITQGGCVMRAGMSYPNRLSRMLNKEIINLGFTGNARLDYEIAEAMTQIDASCLVIDCLPNVTSAEMRERYVNFLAILRKKKPSIPILLVENILYPHMVFDQVQAAMVTEENTILRKEIYEVLKKKGDKNLHYIKAKGLIGDDGEGTVEGIHPTDLGHYRISEKLFPVIRKLIK
ncbi:SGNH/GDSL hydrolase family protein [Arenibacter algicola]|uniref:SGNH/GDSL hydrolase family protein n=1 Tax=Arenibacter algicola TaxID=616991 RepID=UPI001C078C8D|nr:SGNH/GDSL hydrolase family protein [Arenibacter algicola]MBU2904067.1 SGNH/GDSL hydrolase family protein [Arenibacter algicola]